MENQDNMNDSYYKNKKYEQENENININNEDEKKEENTLNQFIHVYESNVYINKNENEDNIIRKYLSEQMTKVNKINNNHNIDNNNNDELNINQITNIPDSDDDIPLLKTYGINDTINTTYEENDHYFNNNNNNNKEDEKHRPQQHQENQQNQEKKEKHGIFLSKQQSSKLYTKYPNQDNQKETSSCHTSSDDDVCLLNLIKNDKNYNINNYNNQNYYEKKNNLKDHDNNTSDYSSYDSDEPILIRSNLKNKINIQTNKLGNTSQSSNTFVNSNNTCETNIINKTTLKSSQKKKSNKFKNINAKTSLSKISCRKTNKNTNHISKKKKKSKTKKKTNKKTTKKTKKTTKTTKTKKTKNITKTKINKHKDKDKQNKGDNHFNDNENDSICIGTFDPRNRSNKEKLVAQLLIRWWYVLPDWPPPDYDYKDELYNRKLKLVPLEEYEDKEDIDSEGFRKVYQISAFPGIFRDAMGIAYDLRDKDSCPCYNNLIKKTDQELLQLIYQAIKNQIQCLKNSVYNETFMEKNLEKELKEVELKLNKITKKNIIKI